MSVTKQWAVSSMDVQPSDNGLTNVVKKVYWKRSITEVDGDNTYTAETYGDVAMPSPSEEVYILYEDLTFETICQWLESTVNMNLVESLLEQEIENKKKTQK